MIKPQKTSKEKPVATGMPVRRRHLIIQLKRLRNEAGLTQDEAWQLVGWSRAKLQRIEKGDFQRVKAGDIMALCQIYKADEAVAQELIEIARDSRKELPWWFQYKDVLPGAFIGMEAEATLIQEYAIALIPGLLQSREYTAELIDRSVGISKDEAKKRLDVRQERQRSVLDREQPPMLMAVVDESAVRRQVGGPQVMKAQIRHMIELSERANIDIQILPFEVGAHAAAGLPFIVLSFSGMSDAGSVVYLEARGDGYYLDSDAEIIRHRLVFSRTQGSALSVENTRDFLEQLIS